MKTNKQLGIALSAGASILALCAHAHAQDNARDVIVVTADKRGAQDIQDVPYNISAVTGETLTRIGADDLGDIANFVPGLTIIDNGPNNSQLVIRGLASNAGAGQVSLYFDEVPASVAAGINNGATDLRAYDVERVEVLRGPQGTLYGAGSQAGTIRYILNKPKLDKVEGSIDGGVGFRARDAGESYSASGMINLPIVEDKFGIRVVGYFRNVDGVANLPDINQFNTDTEETWGGRIIAKLVLTDSTDFVASAYYQDVDLGDRPEVEVATDSRAGSVLQPLVDQLEIYNGTLTHDAGWGEFTATASLFKRETEYSFDISQFLPPPLAALGGGAVNQPATQDIFSGEVRFASTFDSPINFVVGGFYQKRDSMNVSRAIFRSHVDGSLLTEGVPNVFDTLADIDFENKAVFGELYFDVTDRLRLTGGLRWFELDRTASTTRFADAFQPPPPGGFPTVQTLTSSSSDVVYRGNISYDVTEDVLVYGTVSQGFREGGENSTFLLGDIPSQFEPDFVTSYEIGVKSVFADGQLLLNVAGYYMNWTDVQVQQFDDTGRFGFTANAGAANLYGIEVEGEIRPDAIEGFSLNFSTRLSEQQLTEDNPTADPDGDGVIDDRTAGLDGDRLANTYPFEASASIQQEFPIGQLDGFVTANMTYQSEAFTTLWDANPNGRPWGDFVLVNAQLGVRQENWTATFYARNLFNVREPVSWTVQQVPGLDDRIVTTQPREIGVRLGYSF